MSKLNSFEQKEQKEQKEQRTELAGQTCSALTEPARAPPKALKAIKPVKGARAIQKACRLKGEIAYVHGPTPNLATALAQYDASRLLELNRSNHLQWLLQQQQQNLEPSPEVDQLVEQARDDLLMAQRSVSYNQIHYLMTKRRDGY